ncbi:MAG: hypothetical protein HC846_06240 [Blastocatellia bacterium]|nr:hypothetical protein [Blastocatellia bacterium]
MENNLNKIRENTLQQIEKNERNYKLAIFGFAAVELIFIVAFILLADFSNRTHLLMLITTIAGYSIVGFCLIALGIHNNRNTLRILQAIQLSNTDEN